MDHNAKNHNASPAERKRDLLRQGEFYRAGVAHCKGQIKHGARPEVLFHSALDHATWTLRSRVDGMLKPTGTSVASLAPYALSIIRFLRQRGLVKPALGVSAVLGGVALYVQHKRSQQLEY